MTRLFSKGSIAPALAAVVAATIPLLAACGSSDPSGTGGGCDVAEDCPAPSACRVRTCDDHVCGEAFAADGSPAGAASEVAGDCHAVVCDGNGGTRTIVDDGDVPVDGNPCTDDVCTDGAPSNPPKAAGSDCGDGRTCDAGGVCLECTSDAQCPGLVCVNNVCGHYTCNDLAKDGTETDVDCGGVVCPKCATGLACAADDDCLSGTCVGGVCARSCTDQEQNGDEIDVDCGGSCPPCSSGKTCFVDADCASSVCDGKCVGGSLAINEVDYDQPDKDLGEFVEIFNRTDAPVSLAGLSLVLVNGKDGFTYGVVDLSPAGVLGAGQYLVVASPNVAVAPGALVIPFPMPLDNLQNGSPDGIALVDTNAKTLIDALSYEGAITMVDIAGLGMTSLVERGPAIGNAADTNDAPGSLCRFPNGADTDVPDADWKFTATPTPGAPNVL